MEKFQGPTNQCFGGNLGVNEECHGYTGFNLSYGAPCFNLQGESFAIQEQRQQQRQSSLPITSLEDNMPFLEMLKSVDSPYYSDPAPVNPHFRMLLKLQQQQEIQIPGHFSGSSSSDQSSMDYYYCHQMETPQPVAFEPQSCDSATTAKAENLANSSVKPEDNKEKGEQEHMELLEQDHAQAYYLPLHLESNNNENNNMDTGELGQEPPNYASPECRQTVSSPTTTRCLAGTECISPHDTPSKTKSASKPAPPAARLVTGSTTTTTTSGGGGHEREKKKRKRTRPNKNREEVESQRMTHIAVERNRRRQMNDHLNALRSLMPPSFVQRGDQASIIGGAIDFVKELEQLLQSLEAKKRMRASSEDEDDKVEIKGHKGRRRRHRNCGDHSESAPFLGFFSSPQYTSYSTSLFLKNDAEEEDEKEEVINEDELRMMSSNNIKRGSSNNSSSSNEHEYYSLSLLSPSSWLGVDIEVAVVQTHVNLKILGPRRAGQLARAISALEQDLRLTILHLNVTSFRLSVLYSFNLKIEDDCKLGSSADEIATAVYQIFSSANTRLHLIS